MKVLFSCPTCDRPGTATTPRAEPWRCPSCDHLVTVSEPAAVTTPDGVTLKNCAACGNHELYKMKAFPHWIGMTILVGACLGFVVLNALRLQWWAWAVLLGSAAIDGGLYLLVKDVAVCYRCGAQHRGLGKSSHDPFELTIHERYRQERIRTEEARRHTGEPK